MSVPLLENSWWPPFANWIEFICFSLAFKAPFYLFSLISHTSPSGSIACPSNTAVFHTHYSTFAHAVPSLGPFYSLVAVPFLPWSVFWPPWLRVVLWDSITFNEHKLHNYSLFYEYVSHCPTTCHISWRKGPFLLLYLAEFLTFSHTIFMLKWIVLQGLC